MTVKSLVSDLLLLCVFLLIGFAVREKLRFLQKLFLPSSLIGGLILLILGPQGFNLVTVPESFSSIPSILINLVMVGLVFGVKFTREKVASYLDYSCITMTCYGMQMGLGVLLGALLSKIWTGLPTGWGIMGVFSFHGGHGTAAAAGAAFENVGVEGNVTVGMVLSTIGLVVAMAVGMAIVNYGIRKGWGKYVKEVEKQPDWFYGGYLPEDQQKPVGKTVTTSISINHLALQFAWIGLSLFVGKTILNFLGQYSSLIASLPGVLHGVFGGALVWGALCALKLDKYVDLKMIKQISGLLLEVVIFTAVATMNLSFVTTYIAPIMIYSIVLCGLSIPLIFGLSKKFLKDEWFEKACMAFGAATGNTSTGLALVRAVDPDSQSEAGDVHGVYSTIMSWKDIFVGLTPLWLMNGTALTAAVGFGIMIVFFVLTLLLGKRSSH